MARDSIAADPQGKRAERKLVRKLEKAQHSFQRAELKVGKQRTRLERAELKLALSTERLAAIEARLRPENQTKAVIDGTPIAAADGIQPAPAPSADKRRGAAGKAHSRTAKASQKAERAHAVHSPINHHSGGHAPAT